ncbi:hypothetical protein IPA_05385 [Ignicoccus pacificus DSM 13166]|uniref:Uncharacterized protein n=1 Tax=Ignicoccus pacificus DSM 13166 TaxID=940294 RepID=A0A977PLG7_9CREN|nr:hypothetical protein IPA_05385 [Ignicoccus pacificus DSM 13166]
MVDPLRVTVAAIIMLMAIGVLIQTATFVISVMGLNSYAKWILILSAILTALTLSFWVYYVY